MHERFSLALSEAVQRSNDKSRELKPQGTVSVSSCREKKPLFEPMNEAEISRREIKTLNSE
jgi:hypothetical protein